MESQGIYLGWIIVKDIKAAIKFYTEVAGLTLKEYHEEYRWAELAGAGGAILGIGQESAEEPDMKAGMNAVLTLSVENIEKAREHFVQQHATLIGDIIEIPGHVKMQSFKDADGNFMQIVQRLG